MSEEPMTSIDIGGEIDQSEVSLLIYSQEIDPDDITKMLTCNPEHIHRKGDLSRSNRPLPSNAWWIKEEGVGSPEKYIAKILDRISLDEEQWDVLLAHCEVRISCVLTLREWARGFEVDSKILKLLGDLGINLGFSVYYINK